MKRRVAVFVLLSALIWVGYAEAGWYKLNWGMTIDQVRAALTEQVVEAPDYKSRSGEVLYRIKNFVVGKCSFTVALTFNQKKELTEVGLINIQDEDNYPCFLDLEDQLTTKYGPPTQRTTNPKYLPLGYRREWMTNDTRIELSWDNLGTGKGKFLSIKYMSRLAAEEKL